MGTRPGRLTTCLYGEHVVDQLLHLRASIRIVRRQGEDPIEERGDLPCVVDREVEKLVDEHHRQTAEPAVTWQAAPWLERSDKGLQVLRTP